MIIPPALLGLAILVQASSPAFAQGVAERQLVPDPSQQGPKMRIHMGGTANGKPDILNDQPALPGPASDWYVAQWQQSSYFSVHDLRNFDPDTKDARLGFALYSFFSPDRHSSVGAYQSDGSWIYQLQESNGALTSRGGANIFLSTNSVSQPATFDRDITYDLDVKLALASVHYNSPTAQTTGGVLSQSFSGFGLLLIDPVSKQRQFVFLQIPIALSAHPSQKVVRICSLNDHKPQLLYEPIISNSDGDLLPFRADVGPLHHRHYELTNILRSLVSKPYACGAKMVQWSDAARDLANWQLTGMYVGIESQSSDHRAGKPLGSQGDVNTALQLGHILLIRH